ncbi:class I SAM-dependent methyltransferase [Desulfitibacter alkalitolerans]|uniref:class I SAM-dependent methyltransferase n=1 Tax=Desulfitibacter alkalitolerans TaxID=264641 RepID=UPI000AE9D731|nr:class I SAM-dependent methyltransferase [Desulfitibacter alkalitolerans]
MKQWYEKLFDNYGEKYDKEIFTQGTVGECDFIEKELNFDKSLKILDVGCGTGRHSIELSKRGYLVTGIDLSESQLKKAREKAKANNLKIDFLKHDARNLPFENQFDVAIMLCEGGFPLMETDEMNFEILKNATKSLKISGVLRPSWTRIKFPFLFISYKCSVSLFIYFVGSAHTRPRR